MFPFIPSLNLMASKALKSHTYICKFTCKNCSCCLDISHSPKLKVDSTDQIRWLINIDFPQRTKDLSSVPSKEAPIDAYSTYRFTCCIWTSEIISQLHYSSPTQKYFKGCGSFLLLDQSLLLSVYSFPDA